MNAAAIIVAGGASRRFKSRTPKQFLTLGKLPVFVWCLNAFKKTKHFSQIILVVPKLHNRAQLEKKYGITVVTGGQERSDSVQNGLAALREDIDLVAIHDAARPLINPDLISTCVAAAKRHGAAIVALPVHDTVKLSDTCGNIVTTIPRNRVWLAQTPQVFKRKILETAYANIKNRAITDDSQPVELSGKKVKMIPGDLSNTKITSKTDFELIKRLMKKGT